MKMNKFKKDNELRQKQITTVHLTLTLFFILVYCTDWS